MNKIFINSILALILGITTAQANVIKGRVLDTDTGEPLSGAEVVFTETSIDWGSVSKSTVKTDSLGWFQHACQMKMSKLTITASYFGYHSQTVQQMGPASWTSSMVTQS